MTEASSTPAPAGSQGGGWATAATTTGEWVVAALGLAIFTFTVLFTLYQALFVPDSPPVIELETVEVVEAGGGFRVLFAANNSGTKTAASVTVEGQLLSEGRVVESSQVTLGFVPGRSRERGGLFFTQDPRAHSLELRALGYEEP